jgi:Flp pilus assembly protein TadB
MSGRMKVGIAGVAIALVLLIWLPAWVVALLVLGALAIPVTGYLMLDRSQRARITRMRARRQLGR